MIHIRGARVHNLKNLEAKIPRNRFVVITGVSGSGKSSLAIDTLFAEGQRRYVESLSSYARQFLLRMDKPDVDFIHGISPAIAIEQKTSNRSSRSTVGTMTELHDYLRLLFARIGKTISPVSGREVKNHSVTDVVDFILSLPENSVAQILFPLKTFHNRSMKEEIQVLQQKGFTRLLHEGAVVKMDEFDFRKSGKQKSKPETLFVLLDRIKTEKRSAELESRIADSVNTAFEEGDGECIVEYGESKQEHFSHRFELDGMKFEEPSPDFFNFNNPYGACKTCEGFGSIIGIDPDLVIPDKSLSVFEDAIVCWRGEKQSEWKNELIKSALKFDFPIHRPIKDLSEKEYKLLWSGNKFFKGLNAFFEYIETQNFKIQYRVLQARFRGRGTCPDCHGTRLRADSAYVKVGGKNIMELVLMPIDSLAAFFKNLSLTKSQEKISIRLLTEIRTRLDNMMQLGLSYLTLNRLSNTLSGGETQRLNLTRTIGSNLTGSLYILDEPSVGLHAHDTQKLIGVLRKLRDLGNTVVVVEHDPEIIYAADYVIDMGPLAGTHGGEIIAEGPVDEILKNKNSLTGKCLLENAGVQKKRKTRGGGNRIVLKGVSMHNQKNIEVTFPLNCLTVVSGVSGSGKTTLVKNVFYPALQRKLNEYSEKPGTFRSIDGDINSIQSVEMIDQNPLGKSSRSNPVTYLKAYDAIRDLFAEQSTAKAKFLKPKHFSFNVEGGRCETCKGDGEITVEMQFLADIHLPCEDCNGKRFKEEILEITYREKSISDVLDMTVDEAVEFFKEDKRIAASIKPLADVGLGYIRLGQSSSTLSGGEAQRVKLASFLLGGNSAQHVLFIFDEPTTGLHMHDIRNLLNCFDALIEKGHSVIVIEHNLEVIRAADYLIDLGPEGGEGGGNLLYQGPPEGILKTEKSFTAKHLRAIMK